MGVGCDIKYLDCAILTFLNHDGTYAWEVIVCRALTRQRDKTKILVSRPSWCCRLRDSMS